MDNQVEDLKMLKFWEKPSLMVLLISQTEAGVPGPGSDAFGGAS